MNHTPDLNSPCIIWSGATDSDGYGRIQIGEKWCLAHRVQFEKNAHQIPEGLVIDHLCRNRLCVNHLHMEPVTNYVNVMRGNGLTAENAGKLFCKNGHPFSGENLGIYGERKRFCKECARKRWREYRLRRISQGNWNR